MIKAIATLRSVLFYSVLAFVLTATLVLTWLRWDSARPRQAWFDERQGDIATVTTERTPVDFGQSSESVRLVSDSGLRVDFRVIRKANRDAPTPVLLVLGGHRTGRDAVDLFGDAGERAIVGIDYPYGGPEKPRGIVATAKAIPQARQAILDTVPAVSLVLDWLQQQAWVDADRIVVIGASLGVPFAAAAAARDKRISGAILVHGAADNRLWLEVQVARRIENAALHYPLSNVLNWLAYGPAFDTPAFVAEISPRPVLVVGATEDERTPAGQAELLYGSAGEPKRLRYTEGLHIQPGRADIVAELLRIAEEELGFLTQSAAHF
ncbi:MAG: prolyl oligopeptidase family serine peptidase [Woeseiaceae bacterium]